MSDLIRREDAIAEVLAYLCSAPAHDEELLRWDMEQLIRALSAVQPDALTAEYEEAMECNEQFFVDNEFLKKRVEAAEEERDRLKAKIRFLERRALD